MDHELSYLDIQLIPKKCIVDSRSECDTSIKLGKYTFKIPVVPANMKTIITETLAQYLAKNNYFYIMHRFDVNTRNFMYDMLEQDLYTSISVGVNDDSYRLLKDIKEIRLRLDYVTIDIAHAWCSKAEKMIKYIKDNFPDTFVIAGNVCTGEAVVDLEDWGADVVKCGQANGKVCITKYKTGFGRPSVSTLLDCCEASSNGIIMDGGIEHSGDIAKAIALGAKMVMAGNIFAGHDETAGEKIEIDGKYYKIYFGSASQYNKKAYKNVEGKKILVPYKGSIVSTLNEIQEDLQSSISYAGGISLNGLLGVKWVKVCD